MVFVQPSIYGTDNSCLLGSLQHIGLEHGRGVVDFDSRTISQKEIWKLHEQGVRGVRVNLVSVGRNLNSEGLGDLLHAYAKAIKPMKTWQPEAYVHMSLTKDLVNIVPQLGVEFSIAHCGNPKIPAQSQQQVDPYSITGFKNLRTFLDQGSTWVKVSGPYRLSQDPDMKDLEPLVRDMFDNAPDRVC